MCYCKDSDMQRGTKHAHLDTGLAERVHAGPGMAAVGTYRACCISVLLLVCTVARNLLLVECCDYGHLRVQGPVDVIEHLLMRCGPSDDIE